MLPNFLKNISIVIFILSLIVALFMIFCRDASHFKGIDSENDRSFLNAFFNRFYFVVTTITTIGYGDIVPVSMRARMITLSIILFIVVVVVKSLDSLIDIYHKDFAKYVNKIPGTNMIFGNGISEEKQSNN